MSLQISFELDDEDLEHFRLVMLHARDAVARRSPEQIVAAAGRLLEELGTRRTPGFVTDRLDKMRLMMQMISDIDWRLPHAEVKRVLNALAYFAEPDDLIPDEIPGLGFLDDAIMIELICRELRHEIEAYQDFCDFRRRVLRDSGRKARVSREDWLENRRSELQSRMRRRKRKERGGRSSGGIGLLR